VPDRVIELDFGIDWQQALVDLGGKLQRAENRAGIGNQGAEEKGGDRLRDGRGIGFIRGVRDGGSKGDGRCLRDGGCQGNGRGLRDGRRGRKIMLSFWFVKVVVYDVHFYEQYIR
jgi:hypothetical protein